MGRKERNSCNWKENGLSLGSRLRRTAGKNVRDRRQERELRMWKRKHEGGERSDGRREGWGCERKHEGGRMERRGGKKQIETEREKERALNKEAGKARPTSASEEGQARTDSCTTPAQSAMVPADDASLATLIIFSCHTDYVPNNNMRAASGGAFSHHRAYQRLKQLPVDAQASWPQTSPRRTLR